MKKYFKFFVVDTLTESIVGSFDAINTNVARKVVEETIKTNDKLKAIGDSLTIYCNPTPIETPETFVEVCEVCDGLKFDVLSIGDSKDE